MAARRLAPRGAHPCGIDTLAAMKEQERTREIARLWPRRREEAHELYREVGTLRGRVRQLERELAASQRLAETARETNAKLTASLDAARIRLRAIEGSKGWRVIMRLRRLIQLNQPAQAPTQVATATPARATAGPEPTFAQRRAAEAMRRAEVAAALGSWVDSARSAERDGVVLLAWDRSGTRNATIIQASRAG